MPATPGLCSNDLGPNINTVSLPNTYLTFNTYLQIWQSVFDAEAYWLGTCWFNPWAKIYFWEIATFTNQFWSVNVNK